jgi:hypothetical protein
MPDRPPKPTPFRPPWLPGYRPLLGRPAALDPQGYLPEIGFRSGGGGNVFTPASIPDLVLWADPAFGRYQETTGASATTPAGAGDPVGTWKARTGQYATAASTGTRPLVGSATGGPVLTFDGVDDLLTWGDLSASFPTAGTLAVRVLHTGNASTAREFFQTGAVDSYSRFTGVASFPSALRSARVETQPVVPLSWATVVVRSDASGWTRRLNGTQDISTTAAYQAGALWQVGGCTTGINKFLEGGIAPVAAYSRVLTDTECADLEAYMAGLAS